MAKSKRSLKVDLSDVDTEGPSAVAEGDHHVVVEEVEEKEGESSGAPYLNWKLKVKSGDEKGKIVYHITSLQPQALFNLRKTLEAAGMEISDRAMEIDLDELEGLEFMVTIEHEEYKNKTRSRVVDTFSIDGGEEPAEEEAKGKTDDDEPKAEKKAPKKAGKKEEPKFEKGQMVEFNDGEKDVTGKIVSINEEDAKATVKVKGEEWEVDISDLTSAE